MAFEASVPTSTPAGYGEGIHRILGFQWRTFGQARVWRASLLALWLPLFVISATVCFGQRNADSRPAPLDPQSAVQDAKALVAEMLALVPERSTTNVGSVQIRDAEDKEREFSVRFEVTVTPTNWTSSYEVLPSAGAPAPSRLDIIRAPGQPNRYELSESAAAGATNAAHVRRVLSRAEIMAPFAGSDFWISDLGLEFLHWPDQRLRQKNVIRHSKACHVLVSSNPKPEPGGYSRVESWVIIDGPPGIVHADAYNANGERLKSFDPKSFNRAKGELEEMEMRNSKTGSRTVIRFNSGRE